MARFELSDPAIRYAVIGDPVAHSLSPAMQNAAFMTLKRPERYGKFHVTAERLPEFAAFAREHLLGFNITVPHKTAIIPLLDEMTPEAQAVHSVNTVAIRNGRLWGDSTDGYGLETALYEAFGFRTAGAEAVILGAGGAAQAVAGHLVRHGIRRLTIVNRTLAKAEALASLLADENAVIETVAADADATLARVFARADVVIQATSAGLHPGDAPPVAPESLTRARALFDMIYHRTPLQEFARQHGIACADGRGMLLHQGAKSFSLWTGAEAPVEAMREALNAAIAAAESRADHV